MSARAELLDTITQALPPHKQCPLCRDNRGWFGTFADYEDLGLVVWHSQEPARHDECGAVAAVFARKSGTVAVYSHPDGRYLGGMIESAQE